MTRFLWNCDLRDLLDSTRWTTILNRLTCSMYEMVFAEVDRLYITVEYVFGFDLPWSIYFLMVCALTSLAREVDSSFADSMVNAEIN